MRPSCSAIWNCQSSRCRIRLSWYESARWKRSALLGTDDKSLTTGYIPVSDPTLQSHLYKATERTPTDRPPPLLSQAVMHLSPAHTPILVAILFTRILVVILGFKDLKKSKPTRFYEYIYLSATSFGPKVGPSPGLDNTRKWIHTETTNL